jgi:benzylsuccinate CoA-transferase BbsF subunit
VARVTGDTQLLQPEWSDPQYRLEHPARTTELIQEMANRLSRDEMLRQGQEALVLIGPVNSVADIAGDDQLSARGVLRSVPHPHLQRDVTLVRPPFFSTAFEPEMRPAPALGADTAAVLEASAAPRAPQTRREVRHRLPLAGYRVLDFCWLIAGPLTTRLLADMGAEVIRVESMARVDRIREAGVQPPRGFSLETNGVFNDCNTNKKSITIDLNRPGAIGLVKQLVPQCDMVTSNFRPGRMERWGLGYADLRQLRPDIIVLNLPAFGRGGPKEGWGLVGNGVVAMAGLNMLTGFADRPPVGLATLHADFVAPYFGAIALVAALVHRERTGQGQQIEVSQYEAAIQLLDTELQDYLANGVQPERRGNRSTNYAPHGVFACRGNDRWVAIAVRDERDWRELALAMDRPDLASDSRLQSVEDRRNREADLERCIAEWTATQDAWQVADLLQRRGVPASAVEDLEDLLTRDKGMADHYASLQHPFGIDVLAQYQPVIWNGEHLPIVRAPLMGEHTRQVLHDMLGLDDARVDPLVASGVLA